MKRINESKFMKLIGIIMLLFVVSVFLCACPDERDGHPYIIIVNKSDQNIAHQIQLIGKTASLDARFQCNRGAGQIFSDSLIHIPSASRHVGGIWEDYAESIEYIQFLIMDQDTYWKYHSEPCDTIRKYVPILHVYRLSLEDLESMNWTVVYPPKE